MARTTIDDKIARLEAELKTAKASKSKEARKERNSQLVSFGIMLETKYKELTPIGREKLKTWASTLDERNKEKVLAGFERLDTALTDKYMTTYLEPSDADAQIIGFNREVNQPGEMGEDGSFSSNGEFNEMGFRIEK